ncbi:MAG TPA: hypothetical protein VF690_02985 [Hymenobacter sp.]|jgi:hypothetical protein
MRTLLLMLALLLSSCARDLWHAPQVLPPDSIAPLVLPAGGKYKFTAPVNIIMQQGNGNVATPTATTKVKAEAAALGPATAASTKANSTPWQWYALAAVGCLVLVLWLRSHL